MTDDQTPPLDWSTKKTPRRDFLKATTAAMLASGVAPAFVGAQDKADARNAVVGQGEYQYELIHNWGQRPEGMYYRNTHGVAIDSQGQVYMIHQGFAERPVDTVLVFDPDGQFVWSFGAEHCGGGHGIDIRNEDGQDFIYVCDIHNHQVVKYDARGEWVFKLRYPRQPNVYTQVDRYQPTNLCFAPDGGFYVGDGYGSHYIHQYDKQGGWVRTFGGRGHGPGELDTPHGLWLDDRPGREPSLVVADRGNARLQYFSLDGQHISLIEGMLYPANIDRRGETLLVSDLYARLTVLDKDNNVVTHIAYDEAWSLAVSPRPRPYYELPADQLPTGKFVHPHDACFDADGNIFVPEYLAVGRFNKLRRV
jgi:hypothetical protein